MCDHPKFFKPNIIKFWTKFSNKLIGCRLRLQLHSIYIYIYMMMPKIVSKSHSLPMRKTTLAQHKTRRPWESSGVVSAKDPSKVKLENFSQL